jgi:hypothetical protein
MSFDYSHETDIQIDLWFCYGSFFYGFESHLHSCSEHNIAVDISNPNCEDSQELNKFLDLILEKPKGLLRVELRVFIPEKLTKKYKINSPIYLFTDMIPTIVQNTDSSLLMVCSSVQGLSPSNFENWSKLMRQISQQNFASSSANP